MQIVIPEFWAGRLAILSSTSAVNDFTDKASLVYTILDDTLGQAFDVDVADLNQDGVPELLVTNHQPSNGKPSASVYIYSMHASRDFRQQWFRRTIMTNIPTLNKGFGEASPGAVRYFIILLSLSRTDRRLLSLFSGALIPPFDQLHVGSMDRPLWRR